MGIDFDIFGRWLVRNPPAPSFVTFWHGPLDPITFTCLASFPQKGARLRVYTYERCTGLPEGVERVDARRIVPDRRLMSRCLVGGRPSAAQFSDYFRYRAIRRTGACWVDSDIVCLDPPALSRDALVFGHQGRKADGPWALNGAVLGLPRRHPMLRNLLVRSAAAIGQDSDWGAIGPLLITEAARRHGVIAQARPAGDFYPIGFVGFWKMLMPERRAEVERASGASAFIHLWRETYRKAGYDETVAPPEGSYLHDLCRRLGTLDRFSRTYDRDELRTILSAHVRD